LNGKRNAGGGVLAMVSRTISNTVTLRSLEDTMNVGFGRREWELVKILRRTNAG